MYIYFFFFFSSRRRHTRWTGDWSSDVCSSDLVVVGQYVADLLVEQLVLVELKHARGIDDVHLAQCLNYLRVTGLPLCLRSEERRVGKECRSRWWPDQ